MFTIEFVILRDGNVYAVVERMASAAHDVSHACDSARSQFELLRRNRSLAPDGFQILDEKNDTVLRSWAD
jgi:hypothetical protein